MNRAFQDVFGIRSAFDGVPMAGRTDKWILDAAAARAGIALLDGNAGRFRDRYFSRLVEALSESCQPKGVLPGVQNLLAALAMREDVFPALLTGNCEKAQKSSSNISICGSSSDAAHTETTWTIAINCSASRCIRLNRAAPREQSRRTSSSSGIPFTMSRAPAPPAHARSPLQPVHQSSRCCARAAPTWQLRTFAIPNRFSGCCK